MTDLIVRGGTVIDGTGAEPRRADVAISGGKVTVVGDLLETRAPEEIDASGQLVAPGFIDLHQHGDVTPLVDPRGVSSLAQGVTTIVVGNCGHGVSPGALPSVRAAALIGYRQSWDLDLGLVTFDDYFDRLDAAVPAHNVAAFAAHGAVRIAAMGLAARAATGVELDQMTSLVEEAMQAGAVGLSSGLEYSPGRYADQAELQRLCEPVGRRGGAYASHIRNRAEGFVAAVAEAIGIARATGVRLILSHIAPRPYADPAQFAQVRSLIATARADGLDITIDTFPDPWGPSPIASLLPPWIVEGSVAEVLDRLDRPDVVAEVDAAFARGDNFLVRADGSAELRLTSASAHPELIGQSLVEIGDRWSVSPAAAACRLLGDEGADYYSVLIRHRYAREEDLDILYRDPWCAFESDGVVTSPDGTLADLVMNRSTYGYTARVLGELVRERRMISLPEAVRRMTSLPAGAVGLEGRGILREGAFGDLVIFDAITIADQSDDFEPSRSPAGIAAVVVNGVTAYTNGKPTGRHSGRFLRNGLESPMRTANGASVQSS